MLGKFIGQKNHSVCIFPEGTRSRNGNLKPFHDAGFKTLLKAAPGALIVPFVIDGNYLIHKYGIFPLNIGLSLKYTVLEPIRRGDIHDDLILDLVRARIEGTLKEGK
jgi:1-acyl-sn-glycerol-3-phosphate acyltransferase